MNFDVASIAVFFLAGFVLFNPGLKLLWRFLRRAGDYGFVVPVSTYDRSFATVGQETFDALFAAARLPYCTDRRDFNRREWRIAYRLIRDHARHGHPKAKRFLIEMRGWV